MFISISTEEVVARVQVDGGAVLELSSSSVEIPVPATPHYNLTLCVKNLVAGSSVTLDDTKVTLARECTSRTYTRGTTSVSLSYTQPQGNTCDTGKTFSITLLAGQ